MFGTKDLIYLGAMLLYSTNYSDKNMTMENAKDQAEKMFNKVFSDPELND